MYYRFNISRNGRHVFCTGDTITDRDQAAAVFCLLVDRFLRTDGFKIDCVLWTTSGQPIPEFSNYP